MKKRLLTTFLSSEVDYRKVKPGRSRHLVRRKFVDGDVHSGDLPMLSNSREFCNETFKQNILIAPLDTNYWYTLSRSMISRDMLPRGATNFRMVARNKEYFIRRDYSVIIIGA